MDSAQTFLLKKISAYDTNGLNSLGKLNAAHIQDIAEVMRLFALEAITEVAGRLNKGESIDLGDGTTLCLERKRQKSKQQKLLQKPAGEQFSEKECTHCQQEDPVFGMKYSCTCQSAGSRKTTPQ